MYCDLSGYMSLCVNSVAADGQRWAGNLAQQVVNDGPAGPRSAARNHAHATNMKFTYESDAYHKAQRLRC